MTPHRCRGSLGRVAAAADDRGALAPFVVIFALAVFVLAGLVVDGGLAIAKREQAADIAEQAARYAADDVNEADLRNGVVRIDPGACDTRVGVIIDRHQGEGAALDTDGGPACVIAADGESVRVRVRIDYAAQLLTLVGVTDFTARAEAVARPAAGIDEELP